VTKQLLELFQGLDDHDSKLRLSIVPSTPQNNSEDYGIFAAAYATKLVCGEGPSGLKLPFDVIKMRQHLERCLDRQKLEPFPHDPARVPGRHRCHHGTVISQCDIDVSVLSPCLDNIT